MTAKHKRAFSAARRLYNVEGDKELGRSSTGLKIKGTRPPVAFARRPLNIAAKIGLSEVHPGRNEVRA